jgi:hypothetical protein
VWIRDKTLTHHDCGHPPEELLLIFKCCAIETTINGRSIRQFEVTQLFYTELFIVSMNEKWKSFASGAPEGGGQR